ncbi:hypothetical protein [Candidatus Nitrosotenuis uzonensis]|uniref:hypothetical protein n=1 Tax=Candidatus Nitrosotenuis uzonensis TaxID=1407055 RepID=UPI0019612521|nr:hypothetical protein [Candidatus Nitrosotenuis uzonensis]
MKKIAVFGLVCFLVLPLSIHAQTPQDVVYAAKFVCGAISDNSGPLRPGYYDTSISILNKKGYPVEFLWIATINDGPTSNAILRTLEPEKSTGMTCKDIKDIFAIDRNELAEGFVVIRIPVASLKGLGNEQILPESQEAANALEVQVFYTANALPTLPHKVAEEKITFYIIQDSSGKIPKEMHRKVLDVTISSTFGEISNTEDKIKSLLAQKYDLDKNDLGKITVRIKDVSIGVGTLLDDHAISLHVVKPFLS